MTQISTRNLENCLIQVELGRIADFGRNPNYKDDVWMGESYCDLNFDKFCFKYRCGTDDINYRLVLSRKTRFFNLLSQF